MSGKLFKQQLILITHNRSIIILSFLSIIIGIAPIQEFLTLNPQENPSTILTKILNPFIICFGLIFVALVSNLSGEKFRINDLLITQSRKFITIAMIIRVISSQFIIWLLWTIPSLATVWISGLSYFVIGTHFQILLLYVYIYLAMLTLSLLELNLLMITNNTIAFLLAFGMNCLDYYLAKTTDDSLFYYFTNLKSQIDLATKFIIMLFLIGLLTFTLNKIISKKDF